MAKYTPSKSTRSQYGKWSTGYYGKAKGTKFEQSSFWMEDNYLSDLIKADVGHDVIKMASYQRSIANFVKILTNRDDIKVRFHRKSDSYTDGKSVTISSKLDSKNFDATVGLALHEGSHCALTQFNARSLYIDGLSQQGVTLTYPSLFADLVNIIEDRRIDYYVMQKAPGYLGYYKTFYEEYFNSKEIDKALLGNVMNQEKVDHYLFHICNFMNPNRNLNALKALKQIWKVYDLANISRLKNTMEVCVLAHKIHDIIESAVTAQLGKAGGKNDTKKDKKQKGDQGQGDAGNEEGDEFTNPGDMQDQMDSQDDMEQGEDGEGSGTNEDNDDGQDIDDDGEAGSDEDGDAEAGETNAPPVPISPKLAKAIQAQMDFLKGEVGKKGISDKLAKQVNAMTDSDVNIETVSPSKGYDPVEVVVVKGTSPAILNSDILSSHYIKTSWKNDRNKDAVEAGWVLGTMLGKKLKTRDENRSMKSTRLKSGKMEGRLMAELGFGNTQVFSQILHYTVKPSTLHLSIDASGSMGGDKWDAAIKTAVAIGKACSMISNVRVIIDIRGQASGTGAEGYNTRNSRALVWVVYDSKKDNVSVLRTVFPRLWCGASTPEGLCFDAIMKYIIDNAKGQDAYFINISDGEPAFSGYHGDVALAHTQSQVNKMRSNNINVLSFFATERNKDNALGSRTYKDFQRMYGKDSALIDLNDFNALARSLNSLFERGVNA